MLDKEKAEVDVYGSDASQVEKVKVTDINSCDEEDDFGTFKIRYPYEVTISDEKGEEILKEKTQKTLHAKDWHGKFYVKTSGNGGDFVAYTRYMSLLALAKLKASITNEDLPARINLNNFVGMEFEAVVVRLKDHGNFIDWVGTFVHNGVKIPEVEDLMFDESFDKGAKEETTEAAEKPAAATKAPARKGGGAW